MKTLSLKKKSLLITSTILISTLLSGCSLTQKFFIQNKETQVEDISGNQNSLSSLESSNQTTDKIMDFNKSLNLKIPQEPIKENPSVLFLGNSLIFKNTFHNK